MTDDSTKSESHGICHMNCSKQDRKIIAKNSIKNIKSNKIAFDIFEKHFKEYYTILNF